MYPTYYKNINKFVTGVTGLLRVIPYTRNSVKALPSHIPSHPVTPVTGLRTCARVSIFFNSLILYFKTLINYFPHAREIARNNRNNRNNYCFIYIYILDTRNKLDFWCNKQSLTRNNCLKIQQGC